MNTQDRPAFAGGTPAKTTPYARMPRYGDEERRELDEALAQQSLFYHHGNKVKALERAFGEALGVPHAVACSSGTAGIHAALIAAGISPGDEVITSPITDMGTVIPILYQGAVPVFADLLPHTANLDPHSVQARITPRTRAVIAVHLAGNACNLDALRELCTAHQLALIEDCAQAHGCRYRNRPVGTWGDIGCFSFNEFKHIACGDGGIVVTSDDECARRLRLATDKGYDRRPDAPERQAPFLANNYRMTELQGAVALAQLRKLDDIVARRRRWCGALTERLADLDGLLLPRAEDGCEHSWWFYLLRVQPARLGADTDTFCRALQQEGLPTSAHYIVRCVYEYPIFAEHRAFVRGRHPFMDRTYAKGDCPVAEEILDTCVILAVNEAYSDTDLEETACGIRRVAEWFLAHRV